jgi:hypothetical protein
MYTPAVKVSKLFIHKHQTYDISKKLDKRVLSPLPTGAIGVKLAGTGYYPSVIIPTNFHRNLR